jgi:signal transduction histidine kinase
MVRLLASEFKHVEISFATVDASSNALQLPAWINVHLERQTGLYKKFEQGEIVGISAEDGNEIPRPAANVRSSVVLIPVRYMGALRAAIGLVSTAGGPPPSSEDVESARQLGIDAAPVLARLQEIERLQHQNKDLLGRTELSEQNGRDISNLLEKKNALDAILQMRSHLQMNVAHELRTPLAAIRGYARMVLDGRGGEINDTQRQYLRVLIDNTNRLISLVSWMSHVAELSSHQFKLSSFDFREIWTQSVESSREQLAKKSLKLVQRVAPEPFAMTGDREKLAYVLAALINVSVRVANSGATIVAELSHGRERELTFKLSQKDGLIPPEVLEKIFDRSFNTVANRVAANTESGAINLSGVYDVVGMHGGRVFVNNTPGQGATFLFTLPAVTAGEENSHEQAVNSGRRRR